MEGVKHPHGRKRSPRHPVGHPDFVHTYFENVLNEHGVECCCRRHPWWRMSNQHVRANYLWRIVRPNAVQNFAVGHTKRIVGMFTHILVLPSIMRQVGTLPLSLGGMGWRNAERTNPPTSWANWAVCLSSGHNIPKWPPCVSIRCKTQTTIIGSNK